MIEKTTSPFFGAYNARHLNPEEVARQFVPPDKFDTLVALRHSLLVGPRGSGKTHLLKMLQPKALAAWQHARANHFRSSIDYYGVFVAADVTWRAQVEERARTLPPEIGIRYTRAVFILHFREALVSCMLQLTHDRPRLDNNKFMAKALSPAREAELVDTLSHSWNLEPRINSLLSLRQCIVDTLSEFRRAYDEDESTIRKKLASIQPDVLSTARQAVESFNGVTGEFDARWALCFDELEIAPETIQQELFECLRSTDKRLMFKLAISPFNAHTRILNTVTTASAGNDYDAIPLWFTNISDTNNFCMQLWDQKTKGTPAEGLPPWAILGHSRFHYSEPGSDGHRYGKHGPWASAFTSLASIDPSFAKYLRNKGIRPNALDTVPRELMDQVVRKVAPLVGFRNAYLSSPTSEPSTNRLKKRMIKTPPAEIFSGWEAICLATEGNPRWFSGLVTRLILKWQIEKKLTRAAQAREFTVASDKFLAWISAVPVPQSGLAEPFNSGIRGLLDVLGSVFRTTALEGEFSADPVLAFTVNSDLPETIKELLVSALNVGAIVSMNEKEVDFTLADLVGHRFRLVHLLAPRYRLPLRTGENRSLQLLITKYSKESNAIRKRQNSSINLSSSLGLARRQKDLF